MPKPKSKSNWTQPRKNSKTSDRTSTSNPNYIVHIYHIPGVAYLQLPSFFVAAPKTPSGLLLSLLLNLGSWLLALNLLLPTLPLRFGIGKRLKHLIHPRKNGIPQRNAHSVD